MESTIQIKEIVIQTSVTEDLQTGTLEVTLHAEGKRPAFLCAQLLTRDGEEADRIFPVPVEPQTSFCMQVSPVRLWDTEGVYLYDLCLELRDARMRLLGCTVKKAAFYRWERDGHIWKLNGRIPRWRIQKAPADFAGYSKEQVRDFLASAKLAHYNALLAADTMAAAGAAPTEDLQNLCWQYGLSLVWENNTHEYVPDGKNPDFELDVTQQGVLIENRCVFINASEYDLRYSLLHNGAVVCSGLLCADVPPGTARYLEIPFDAPKEAGEYTYRAALCLRRDTCWAEKGTEVAYGETMIRNMYLEGAQQIPGEGEQTPARERLPGDISRLNV